MDIDIESQLNKVLKLYREWQGELKEDIALECEREVDILKVALGDRFYELTYFNRIALEVTKYLNMKQDERVEQSQEPEPSLFDRPTLDKVGREMGIA